MAVMDVVICPGRGQKVASPGHACPVCGYENNIDGRLLCLDYAMTIPNPSTRLKKVDWR